VRPRAGQPVEPSNNFTHIDWALGFLRHAAVIISDKLKRLPLTPQRSGL
jgi:hypothetical protein